MIDKETIQKLKERIYPFKNSEGKWGYTDIFGKVVVPAQFDEIEESIYHVKGIKEFDGVSLSLRDFLKKFTNYNRFDSSELDWDEFYNTYEDERLEACDYIVNKKIIEYKGVKYLREDLSLAHGSLLGCVTYRLEKSTNRNWENQYGNIFPFSEGMARVCYYHPLYYSDPEFCPRFIPELDMDIYENYIDSLSEDDLEWGFIDENGVLKIPLEYNNASDFHEGLAAVENWKGWGYINNENEVVIPFAFDWADQFEDGYARVVFAGLYYIIDKDGVCYESFEDLESGDGSKFYL